MSRNNIIHDSIYLGLLAGTIVPVVGSAIYKFIEFGDITFAEYYDYMLDAKVISKFIAVSIIVNLPVAYLFYYLRYELALKGVILASVAYSIISMILILAA